MTTLTMDTLALPWSSSGGPDPSAVSHQGSPSFPGRGAIFPHSQGGRQIINPLVSPEQVPGVTQGFLRSCLYLGTWERGTA